MESFDFTPVVILGAARSGTNMLRDALTGLPGFGTWPCDEIDPVWRHLNLDWPDDEIPPARATEPVRDWIRKAFSRRARKSGARFLVEKTCANTLRVPFVAKILPEARFIHIVRDGRAVTLSASRRWTGKTPLGYTLAKARFVPLADLPAHSARFLRNSLRIMAKKPKATWGPRFSGMREMAAGGAPLETICATQWARSVTAATMSLGDMPADRVLTLRYEEVTRTPAEALRQVADFLGAEAPESAILAASEGVRPAPPPPADLPEEALAVLSPVLERLGYAP